MTSHLSVVPWPNAVVFTAEAQDFSPKWRGHAERLPGFGPCVRERGSWRASKPRVASSLPSLRPNQTATGLRASAMTCGGGDGSGGREGRVWVGGGAGCCWGRARPLLETDFLFVPTTRSRPSQLTCAVLVLGVNASVVRTDVAKALEAGEASLARGAFCAQWAAWRFSGCSAACFKTLRLLSPFNLLFIFLFPFCIFHKLLAFLPAIFAAKQKSFEKSKQPERKTQSEEGGRKECPTDHPRPQTLKMGKKGKKAQVGKPKKLTPKDINKLLDSLVKKLEKELEGADLFAPLPPAEDCPVCFLPLSRMLNRSIYKPCCGKSICGGCHSEHVETSEASGGGLGSCPFCRAPELASWAGLCAATRGKIFIAQ